MKKLFFTLVVMGIMGASGGAYAWSGYDYQSNTNVEIEPGTLVREGQTIDVFDHSSGEYKMMDVMNMQKIGQSVEIEAYDYNSGEIKTFEMDVQR